MAVPARPVAGALLDSAWGGLVHDAVVAMDIQAGYVEITTASAVIVGAAIVFPRPFAAGSVPAVVVGQGGNVNGTTGGETVDSGFYGASPTGFTLRFHRAIAGTATALRAHWIAYGPRA